MIRRRTVLLLASHGAILLLGMAIGAWIAVERVTGANALLEDVGAIERMSSYVHAHRTLGDSRAYEAALNELLTALERQRSNPGPIMDEKMIGTDVTLTHTRLALLAELMPMSGVHHQLHRSGNSRLRRLLPPGELSRWASNRAERLLSTQSRH
jgi:hypothetical protein